MATGATRILQGNLNHCARAQDLLVQTMAEWRIDVAVVAELYAVPCRHNWSGDSRGSVAIVGSGAAGSAPIEPFKKDDGYVAVKRAGTLIIGVYCSPNRQLQDLEALLEEVGILVQESSPSPMIVLGDLNARSREWGDITSDARGKTVREWAVSIGLWTLNRGSTNTCVRRNGRSIVDVSFASPFVGRRVSYWRVEETETMSDHRYIRFDVSRTAGDRKHRGPGRNEQRSPRWAIRRANKEALEEASIVMAWQQHPAGPIDVEEEAAWFMR